MHSKHKLRAERDDSDLTQKGLGAIAGVSASTISHIECHRGPDVPRSERRTTKTRLSTALKLTAALSGLGPGKYTFGEFVGSQSLFTEDELYEALINQQARARRRKANKRHLRVAA